MSIASTRVARVSILFRVSPIESTPLLSQHYPDTIPTTIPIVGCRHPNRCCLYSVQQPLHSNLTSTHALTKTRYASNSCTKMSVECGKNWTNHQPHAMPHGMDRKGRFHPGKIEVLPMNNVGAGRSCFGRPKRPTPSQPQSHGNRRSGSGSASIARLLCVHAAQPLLHTNGGLYAFIVCARAARYHAFCTAR